MAARTVTLAIDFPGYPAGTLLTQDAVTGRFVSGDGKFFQDARLVDTLAPTQFREVSVLWKPVANTDQYFYLADDGSLQQVSYTGSKADTDRIAAGNCFRTIVLTRLVGPIGKTVPEILKQLQHAALTSEVPA